jgi:hypothetical protein
MLAFLALLQLVHLETPPPTANPLHPQPGSMETASADLPVIRPSTIDRPLKVPANELPTPAQVLQQGQELSKTARIDKLRSILPIPTIAGCTVTSSNPSGVFRVADGALNGRVTFARCDGFVVALSISDLSAPTNPSMAVKQPTSPGGSIVNGGYRSATYTRATDGRQEIVIGWISTAAAKTIDVDIYPQTIAARQATDAGHRILDALTAAAPR